MIGVIILHGPHHGAQKSIRAGVPDSSTSALKVLESSSLAIYKYSSSEFQILALKHTIFNKILQYSWFIIRIFHLFVDTASSNLYCFAAHLAKTIWGCHCERAPVLSKVESKQSFEMLNFSI
jgi:hypothetical protein